MTPERLVTPDASMVVDGSAGQVYRAAAPSGRAASLPVEGNPVVDVWTMPGDMRMAVLHRHEGRLTWGYAFILAYVDSDVDKLARTLGLARSLAVDVWHVQPVTVTTDHQARQMMRCLAHSAADGALPFSPIRMADRALWQYGVDAMSALAVQTADAAV